MNLIFTKQHCQPADYESIFFPFLIHILSSSFLLQYHPQMIITNIIRASFCLAILLTLKKFFTIINSILYDRKNQIIKHFLVQ